MPGILPANYLQQSASPDGKDFKWVAGITQDVNGYMWYATQKGLYSYDGYHMTSYKSNPLNPNSLMSNNLVSVLADSNGIIWIGIGGMGLDRLDPVTGIFTHFRHDSNDPASLASDAVTVILKDKQETLWIGTYDGLDQFDPKTNKFIHYRYNANDPTSISNNKVRAIYEDRQGTIWIGTGSPYPWDGDRPEKGIESHEQKDVAHLPTTSMIQIICIAWRTIK
jgi:ligand-binding sensor domain-containing protein